MTELHLPWLELALLSPLCGAVIAARLKDWHLARKASLFFFGLTLAFATGAWLDFQFLGVLAADDRGHLLSRLLGGHEVLVIDQLSAPLLPLVALLYFLTASATVRTKVRRFSLPLSLVSESLMLTMYSLRIPWAVIALLAIGTLVPYFELRARGKPTRIYCLHMLLFVVLLVGGQVLVDRAQGDITPWLVLPLVLAVLVRNGIVPFHLWMADLFEHATFGSALLFVTPMAGAYAAIRLLVPIAPTEVLQYVGLLALATAFYGAGMALIQREARRFFCYLFLSNAALVLVGLDVVSPNGMTGGLCVWLSVGLSLGGLGLTLRALEARRGKLSMREFQGLYEHTPNLAICFGLTGLASVGFPGTFGFIGGELLVEGAVDAYPLVGITVVLAAAINGIAIVQAFFRLFAGGQYRSSVSLNIRRRERFAVLTLAGLILLGGFIPQPIVESRSRAAEELLEQRQHQLGEERTFARPAPAEAAENVPARWVWRWRSAKSN